MPPHISLFIVATVLVVSHYYIEYELKQVIRMEEKRKELQGQLKDAEKLLVDKMDPQLLETVKKVMRLEMKGEIEAMRTNQAGCTEKCQLKNTVLEQDLGRHKLLVEAMIGFQWCQECSQVELGAAKTMCQVGCGRNFYSKCLPLMKSYGKRQQTIQELNAKLAKMEERDVTFKAYQEKKQQLKDLAQK